MRILFHISDRNRKFSNDFQYKNNPRSPAVSQIQTFGDAENLPEDVASPALISESNKKYFR